MKLALILNFAVNFLLLLATQRLSGCSLEIFRSLCGGVVSTVFATMGTMGQFAFLQSKLWYVVSLGAVCIAAFRLDKTFLRRSGLFCLLRLALDGIADGSHGGQDLLWAAVLSLVCVQAFGGGVCWQSFVPVELSYKGRSVKFTALHDTGNQLRDPVTGKGVLVVDAQIARELTGLSRQQLLQPLETIGTLPGLRLIPYKTVGQSGGFLLAVQVNQTKVGKWKGSSIVAMSPQELDGSGAYQALIGGTV